MRVKTLGPIRRQNHFFVIFQLGAIYGGKTLFGSTIRIHKRWFGHYLKCNNIFEVLWIITV